MPAQSTTAVPLQTPPPCYAVEELPSAALLSLIPAMPFGAPATNATLPSDVVQRIEEQLRANGLWIAVKADTLIT